MKASKCSGDQKAFILDGIPVVDLSGSPQRKFSNMTMRPRIIAESLQSRYLTSKGEGQVGGCLVDTES
jgi:hypothetical protein